MTKYLAIAAFVISLISLLVAVRIAIFNYRVKGAELRHRFLKDAADAQERAVHSRIEVDYLKTIAPGTLFEQELLEMDFPSLASAEDSVKSLIKNYRELPLHQAIGSHAAYQDRLLVLQSALSAFENRLKFIKSMVVTHGSSPTA